MSSFADGLEAAARNAVCDISRYGVSAGLLYAGLTAVTVGTFGAGLAVAGLSAIAYAALCNQPLPPEFRGRRPFTGGQCPTAYRIDFFVKAEEIATGIVEQRTFFFRLQGPIEFAEIIFDPTEENGKIFYRVVGSQEDLIQELLVDYGNLPLFPNYRFFDPEITATRIDGLPDDCGDPPIVPPIVPPGGNIVPTNITYVNNEGVTVNVPITLNLGIPRVDIRGELNMPITVKFDLDADIDVRGELNFNTGDFNINFGNPADSPGGGADDDTVRPDGDPPPVPPGVPEPLPPEPDPDPTVSRNRIMKGCIVTVNQVDERATLIFQDQNPDIYAPALGYVQFFIRTGRTGGWTEDIPIKNRRQFIPCPWFLGAVDVKGTPRGNASITVTPVYTSATLNPSFPPETIS